MSKFITCKHLEKHQFRCFFSILVQLRLYISNNRVKILLWSECLHAPDSSFEILMPHMMVFRKWNLQEMLWEDSGGMKKFQQVMRTHTNNNNNQKSEMQNQKSMFSFFRNQTHLKQKSRNKILKQCRLVGIKIPVTYQG